MKRYFVGLLIRLLTYSLGLNIDYKKIDKKAVEEWAFRSFDDKGWRSYFAYEDLRILKEMSYGKGPWDYPILVGRRLQLLQIFDEMNKSVQNRKSAEEKKQSEKAGEAKP